MHSSSDRLRWTIDSWRYFGNVFVDLLLLFLSLFLFRAVGTRAIFRLLFLCLLLFAFFSFWLRQSFLILIDLRESCVLTKKTCAGKRLTKLHNGLYLLNGFVKFPACVVFWYLLGYDCTVSKFSRLILLERIVASAKSSTHFRYCLCSWSFQIVENRCNSVSSNRTYKSLFSACTVICASQELGFGTW